jgi:hypothetical protein
MNEQSRARVNGGNPGHHLWLNHGTWFIHYTVHRADYTKLRVRASLQTKSLARARRLRDHVLRSGVILAGRNAVRGLPIPEGMR